MGEPERVVVSKAAYKCLRAGSGKRNPHLRFEATDYYADTWVNGRFAGRHEGYIEPVRIRHPSPLAKAGSRKRKFWFATWTPVTYYWRDRARIPSKGSYGAVDQKPDEITAAGITRSGAADRERRSDRSERRCRRERAYGLRCGRGGRRPDAGGPVGAKI